MNNINSLSYFLRNLQNTFFKGQSDKYILNKIIELLYSSIYKKIFDTKQIRMSKNLYEIILKLTVKLIEIIEYLEFFKAAKN